jgi:hypothetical protein
MAETINLIINADTDQGIRELNKLIGGIGKVSKGTEDMTKSATKSTAAWKDFFKGMLAFEAVKRGLDLAIQGTKALARESLEMAKLADQVNTVNIGFERTAKIIGTDAATALELFRNRTRGMIPDLELLRKANVAVSLGVVQSGEDIGKFGKLMDIARASARLTGQDMGYMFDSIVTGIGRASPLILDNLGLAIKIGDVNDNYAKSIGKVADQLTIQEQKTGLLNAVMIEGDKLIERAGANSLNLSERLLALNTAIENARGRLGVGLVPIIGRFADVLTRRIPGVVDRFAKGLGDISREGVMASVALDNFITEVVEPFAELAGKFLRENMEALLSLDFSQFIQGWKNFYDIVEKIEPIVTNITTGVISFLGPEGVDLSEFMTPEMRKIEEATSSIDEYFDKGKTATANFLKNAYERIKTLDDEIARFKVLGFLYKDVKDTVDEFVELQAELNATLETQRIIQSRISPGKAALGVSFSGMPMYSIGHVGGSTAAIGWAEGWEKGWIKYAIPKAEKIAQELADSITQKFTEIPLAPFGFQMREGARKAGEGAAIQDFSYLVKESEKFRTQMILSSQEFEKQLILSLNEFKVRQDRLKVLSKEIKGMKGLSFTQTEINDKTLEYLRLQQEIFQTTMAISANITGMAIQGNLGGIIRSGGGMAGQAAGGAIGSMLMGGSIGMAAGPAGMIAGIGAGAITAGIGALGDAIQSLIFPSKDAAQKVDGFTEALKLANEVLRETPDITSKQRDILVAIRAAGEEILKLEERIRLHGEASGMGASRRRWEEELATMRSGQSRLASAYTQEGINVWSGKYGREQTRGEVIGEDIKAMIAFLNTIEMGTDQWIELNNLLNRALMEQQNYYYEVYDEPRMRKVIEDAVALENERYEAFIKEAQAAEEAMIKRDNQLLAEQRALEQARIASESYTRAIEAQQAATRSETEKRVAEMFGIWGAVQTAIEQISYIAQTGGNFSALPQSSLNALVALQESSSAGMSAVGNLFAGGMPAQAEINAAMSATLGYIQQQGSTLGVGDFADLFQGAFSELQFELFQLMNPLEDISNYTEQTAANTDPQQQINTLLEMAEYLERFRRESATTWQAQMISGILQSETFAGTTAGILGAFPHGGTVPQTGIYHLERGEAVIPNVTNNVNVSGMMTPASPAIIHIDGQQFKGYIEKTAYNYIARR